MNNFFTKALGAVPIRKSDVVEKDREASLRAWEKRERAPFDRLLDAKDAQTHLEDSKRLASAAGDDVESAGKAKDRGESTMHLMSAHKKLKDAEALAGRSGETVGADYLSQTANSVAAAIDAVHAQKLDRPDDDKIRAINSTLRAAKDYIQTRHDAYQQNYEKDGKGALPGLRALPEGAGSRTTNFVGGIEMRLHREDIRHHLHRVGYGRVDQSASNPFEHELWEAPDGRTVRITYESKAEGKRSMAVKERSRGFWRSTREEFKRQYAGNKGLLEDGAKPGIPPKGVKIAISSEIPFMPLDRPKGKKAGA